MAALIPIMQDGRATGEFLFTGLDPSLPSGAYIAQGKLEIPDPGPLPKPGERREYSVSLVVIGREPQDV